MENKRLSVLSPDEMLLMQDHSQNCQIKSSSITSCFMALGFTV